MVRCGRLGKTNDWLEVLTTVPRRATLAPAVRTLARATLPKLPSPISFNTSNLSPRAIPCWPCDDPLRVESSATAMVLAS